MIYCVRSPMRYLQFSFNALAMKAHTSYSKNVLLNLFAFVYLQRVKVALAIVHDRLVISGSLVIRIRLSDY